MITRWIFGRLGEASTWTGIIVTVLAAIGLPGEAGTELAGHIAVMIAGVFSAIKRDRGHVDGEN